MSAINTVTWCTNCVLFFLPLVHFVMLQTGAIPVHKFFSSQQDVCFFHFDSSFSFKVLEGRSYRLQHPWVGIVNRSQADINKNIDMIVARRKEREYFETSPDYGHLANKMGSEYLAKLLSKVELLQFLLASNLGMV